MTNTQTTRREVAAAMIIPRHVLGGRGYQAPSDTLRIAATGIGGMGRRYLDGCAGEQVIALCDVDQNFAAPVFRKYPDARVYRDFRQMFDKEEKNIDAVIVGTPDHTHAAISIQALRMRKHLYCAKPLTHTIPESRRVAEAVRAAGVATQMSVQSCASNDACAVTEMLLSGAIGPVREAHIWVDHPLYPANLVRPPESPAAPQGFDWDLWLGPAPYRPYHSAYHPWNWRAWWDFGNGSIGDMLCHSLHMFHDALKLTAPSFVHSSRSAMYRGPLRRMPDLKDVLPERVQTPESESHASMVTWDFPERAGLPALRMHWYDGGLRPHRPVELAPRIPMPNSGMLFVGEEGKLMCSSYAGGILRLLPEQRFKDYPAPPPTLTRTAGHYKEWVLACKTGRPTSCHLEYGAKMTELALLGALAARAARLLEWDPVAMRFPNDAEASAWIDPPRRAGWPL